MRILAISKFVDKEKTKDSAIHLWRVKRPLLELQKHVDWQIEFRSAIIEDFHGLEQEPDEFIRQYGVGIVRDLSQYDIIFCSYFTSPHIYTLLWGVQHRYKTKVVMDFDDDLFDVDPSNFGFWQPAGWQGHEFLGIIARVQERLVTTNERLAEKLKDRSECDAKVWVIPNYISDAYPEQVVDNGDKVVIGFFGGASHYADLHKSNVLPALQKLMHKYKHVYFKVCGQPVDYYLPSKRVEYVDVAQGNDWPTERLPSLNLDIAVAPLLVTEFNQHKSNIKWQEATRMGSAFVGTNTGAYKDIPSGTAVLVNNTVDDWYNALESLVLDADKRKELVTNAKKELRGWWLEDERNWSKYKELFEEVVNE